MTKRPTPRSIPEVAPGSPVIRMPEDKREFITGKLAEYRVRLTRIQTDIQLQHGEFWAPETIHPLEADTLYKIAIAEALLKNGSVQTWEISRELAAKYPSLFRPSAFTNACVVMEAYCQGRENEVHQPGKPESN